VIIDASVAIDALADSGSRGAAARNILAELTANEPLIAPGHFPIELLSGLRAAANRPGHPLRAAEIPELLIDVEDLGISVEATPWSDVRRAWTLAQSSIRYSDAVYVAAAERHGTTLLTADTRIGRSGASIHCEILTVRIGLRDG
jgi:predicted nucleic acid-binding protein